MNHVALSVQFTLSNRNCWLLFTVSGKKCYCSSLPKQGCTNHTCWISSSTGSPISQHFLNHMNWFVNRAAHFAIYPSICLFSRYSCLTLLGIKSCLRLENAQRKIQLSTSSGSNDHSGNVTAAPFCFFLPSQTHTLQCRGRSGGAWPHLTQDTQLLWLLCFWPFDCVSFHAKLGFFVCFFFKRDPPASLMYWHVTESNVRNGDCCSCWRIL